MTWLLGQLLLTVAGTGAVRLALRRSPWRELGPIGLVGLSLLAGPALLGVVTTLLAVTGVGVAMPLLTAVLLPVAGLGAWPRRLPWEVVVRPREPSVRRAAGELVAGLVALVPAVLVALVARQTPVAVNDEYSTWALKGRVLSATGGLDPAVFLSASYGLPDYPLLLPSLIRWSDGLAGRPDDGLAHVPLSLLLAGALLTTAWAVTRIAGPLAGWAATALVATVPGVTGRFGVFLYADVPLLALALGTALTLLVWLHAPQPRWAALAAVLGAGALATKAEAVLFVAALLLAALLARPRHWRALVLAGAVMAAAALPWRAWVVLHDLPSPFAGQGTFSRANVALRLPYADAVSSALLSQWVELVGPVALLAVVAVAVGAWRGVGRLGAALCVWLVLVLGGLWVQYLLYPLSDKPADERRRQLVAHVESTSDRVLLLPAALVLLAVPLLALGRPAPPEPAPAGRDQEGPDVAGPGAGAGSERREAVPGLRTRLPA